MRFSEATALIAADIDTESKTCRINKAWKYSGNYWPEIGPPKSKKSIRTISLPPAALEVIDLTAPGFLFTNGAGNPVRAQEFFNGGWKPGRDSALCSNSFDISDGAVDGGSGDVEQFGEVGDGVVAGVVHRAELGLLIGRQRRSRACERTSQTARYRHSTNAC
jgi:hypothetical protein